MRVYKCDICGAFMDVIDRGPVTIWTGFCEVRLTHVDGSYADICPSCKEKFSDFIKGLTPEEKESNESETSSSKCEDILE